MRVIIILCVFCLLTTQCKPTENKEDTLVAKVYNDALYESELIELAGFDNSELNREEYIDSWIRKKLLLRNAKISRKVSNEINQLTENYREALTIQKHKESIISQKLQRQISENELNQVYEDLKTDFRLQSDIMKIELYVTKADHFDKLDLKSFFKKKEYDEFYNSLARQVELEKSDTANWTKWTSMSQYIPKELLDESELEANKDFVLENDKYLFFLRVHDLIDKNDSAPLSYMKPFLEQSILEKRKERLLNEHSVDLYKSAVKNNKLQIN